MDRHICRAKDINTGEWVYGYYVAVSHFGHPEHVIIEEDTQYDGCGEFWWMDVHDVDPEITTKHLSILKLIPIQFVSVLDGVTVIKR